MYGELTGKMLSYCASHNMEVAKIAINRADLLHLGWLNYKVKTRPYLAPPYCVNCCFMFDISLMINSGSIGES